MRNVLFLLFLISSKVSADCNYTAFADAFFSNSKTKDRLYSRIIGKNCSDAKQVLLIESADGEELYRYEEKNVFKYGSKKIGKEEIDRYLNWPLREPVFFNTAELPSWIKVTENPFDYFITFKVDKKTYSDYRKKKWKAFSHGVGYESGRTLVYDREKNEVILVSTTDP